MKTFEVSNAVFGALWSRAIEADQTENDILRRLLGLPATEAESAASLKQATTAMIPATAADNDAPGYIDPRFGVRFPAGFQIFRTYKHTYYAATARGGQWHLPAHGAYDSLAALSAAIGAATENAWFGWRYQSLDGTRPFIGDLRDDVKEDKARADIIMRALVVASRK